MPLLPSALPPKGEARRYVANDFLNLIALRGWAAPYPGCKTVRFSILFAGGGAALWEEGSPEIFLIDFFYSYL